MGMLPNITKGPHDTVVHSNLDCSNIQCFSCSVDYHKNRHILLLRTICQEPTCEESYGMNIQPSNLCLSRHSSCKHLTLALVILLTSVITSMCTFHRTIGILSFLYRPIVAIAFPMPMFLAYQESVPFMFSGLKSFLKL